jgi:hypothetical protein
LFGVATLGWADTDQNYWSVDMPADMIALNRGGHDWKKQEYWAACPSFKGLGAKRLAIYTPLAALEVMGPLEGAVVIEFPDLATAKG